MRQLYEKNSANYPRLKTDKFFVDYGNIYRLNGYIKKLADFIEDFQLTDDKLWSRFVNQFREDDADSDSGWRCEYWGKMMRGACFTYSMTRNEALMKSLVKTVSDMLSVWEEKGRISTYAENHEFDAWDLWGRKYVLLGMQYFIEICPDKEFCKKVTESMCKQSDYIISKVGRKEDGKIPITAATHHWRGLNSSSILEPIVRLYSITGKKEYFDFASYIVECGGADCENIFKLAYENKLYPYQYPVTKAYEMISCFEGLLEYYRVTGIEKYKTAVINFADKILESDFTVIGSCGCTHELFDHSSVRQANRSMGVASQETCVTVTLMKFFYQLMLITGKPHYADAFEKSMYNAFFGSVNTDKAIGSLGQFESSVSYREPMPFDSYSPLTADSRGNGIGGFKVMSDGSYYGCCACIGAIGFGLAAKMSLLTAENGFAVNLYMDGDITSKTPSGNEIVFKTETDYPVSGKIRIKLLLENPEKMNIMIRNPEWSKTTRLSVNGESTDVCGGYIGIERTWNNGDVIELLLDMRTEAIYPIPYGHDILMNKVIWGLNYVVPTYDEEDPMAKHHIALRRGPVMLAEENRLGCSVDRPADIKVEADGYVNAVIAENKIAPYENMLEMCVPLKNGEFLHVTDYASAGKTLNDESKMAVWMLTDWAKA